VVHVVPPLSEYSILAFEVVPNRVQVMVCDEHPCQFSPPFGDVTVTTGSVIVKLVLLMSNVVGVVASLTFTRHCEEGVFGMPHE